MNTTVNINEDAIPGLIRRWTLEFKNIRFRYSFLFSVLLLAVVLFSLTRFLNFIENRPGVVINDPILAAFKPIELTWIIFAVIYASIAGALITLIPNPQQLLFTLQIYTLMVIVRIAAMFLLPLEPPQEMIILQDPFVEFFGTGETLTKDLFFSGHTASILIFTLTALKLKYKIFFLSLTILIAVMVILQKVHYTIDVYAAVLFTIACFYIIKALKQKYHI